MVFSFLSLAVRPLFGALVRSRRGLQVNGAGDQHLARCGVTSDARTDHHLS
jgi:hypothetical protein